MNWQLIKRINRFAPTIGAVVFLALYAYAVTLYPGGSRNHPKAIGFSFFENYWCDLLTKYSINGNLNPARPYAITAMIFITLGLGNFFYHIPLSFKTDIVKMRSIQVTGNLSVVFILLIFTRHHDILITISSVFGLVALVLVFIVLNQHNASKLFWIGLLSAILLALNGSIYGTDIGIDYLPLIQKFTFGIMLIWIVSMNIEIDRKLK